MGVGLGANRWVSDPTRYSNSYPLLTIFCYQCCLDASRSASDPTKYSNSYPLQLFSLSACWSGFQSLFIRSYNVQQQLSPSAIFVVSVLVWMPAAFRQILQTYSSSYPLQLFSLSVCWSGCQPLCIRPYKVQQQLSPSAVFVLSVCWSGCKVRQQLSPLTIFIISVGLCASHRDGDCLCCASNTCPCQIIKGTVNIGLFFPSCVSASDTRRHSNSYLTNCLLLLSGCQPVCLGSHTL